jgi:outer membrane protein
VFPSTMRPRCGHFAWPLVAAAMLCVRPAFAQAPTGAQAPATLTLDEAITMARQNNPDLQIARNDETPAVWSLRQAYGQFLPSVTTTLGMQYQAKGSPSLGIFTGQDLGLSTTQSYYYSDYGVTLGYQLSGSTFLQLSQAHANLDAAQAQTANARYTLDSNVTQRYLAVLAGQDAVKLAQQQLQTDEENLKLAQAKVQVGNAIELEAKQAEVQRGKSEVALIKAQNQLEAARLQLAQEIGAPLDPNVELTTTFQVFEPTWTVDALLQKAMSANPSLNAQRATVHASSAALRMARSAYLPSLSLSMNFSGYTRQAGNTSLLVQQANASAQTNWESCSELNQINDRLTSSLPGFPVDCSQFLLSDQQRQAILDQNNAFPFRFSRQPMTFQARLSLPIFNGLTRQQQVEQARATADDASYRLHAQELQLRTDVTTLLNNVRTAYRTAQLDEQNAKVASDQLDLARQRYRLGMTNFVDLIQAETLKTQADDDYLQARYDFHISLAALEAAVGQRLRNPGAPQ